MIIDHNRSLPKRGSSSLSTPNKSPSPLPHKPTPQQTAKSQQVHTHQSDQSTADTTKAETTPSDPLLAMVHQSIHTSDDDASDITKVLSAKRSRQIQACKRYIFQHANHTNNQLVDRGANGGFAGSDMQVIYKTHCKINISGIDNHEVTGLDVVTAATLLNTSLGKVIGIFNEYAYLGKGSSIHSSGQLEWFKTLVDEKSIKVGGTQLITTLDGYSVPLLIRDGLAYATSLGKPTDQDMDTYPHVFFTSPDEWDPSVLNHDPPHLDGLDPSQVSDQHFGDPMFDAYGDFIDIRTTLRYLGVPIRDKSYMFGDNRSVVTSSTIPNSTISKRHHLASYHRVREAIAAKFISFHWKDGKSNPADILSKHWEFATVWPLLKPILFWRGETATQLKGSDRIPSTTPGAEPPRDAKDSGSARSHSTHLETSSSNRP